MEDYKEYLRNSKQDVSKLYTVCKPGCAKTIRLLLYAGIKQLEHTSAKKDADARSALMSSFSICQKIHSALYSPPVHHIIEQYTGLIPHALELLKHYFDDIYIMVMMVQHTYLQ